MVRFWLLMFTALIQVSGNAQSDDQRIRISDDIELIRISENAFFACFIF